MARPPERGLGVRRLTPADLGPILTTERLVLRPPCEDDLDAIAALYADPENSRFIGGPEPRVLAWRRLMSHIGSWAAKGFAMFAVTTREGEWIGQLGPWRPEGWPGLEVGWALLPAAQGRGYAVEAVSAALDWTFEALAAEDVIHSIHPENTASIRLAERLGSSPRGPIVLPAPYAGDALHWGQTRDEWRARRGLRT